MKLPRLPWLWMMSKPSSRIRASSFFAVAGRLLPGMIRVSMPMLRASSVNSLSMKQTMVTPIFLLSAASRLSTWVLAPPTSPPLMRVRIFMAPSLPLAEISEIVYTKLLSYVRIYLPDIIQRISGHVKAREGAARWKRRNAD